jgi:hypothetical protein
MCIVNLNDTLSGQTVNGVWTQLTGPSTIVINNDIIDTANVTPGTYTFEYCIDMCGPEECTTSTIIVKDNHVNFTKEYCIDSGTLNIVNIINTETGNNPLISTTTHSIGYADGSLSSPAFNFTNNTIDTTIINPGIYTIRVTRTDVDTYCTCFFDVTFDFESCRNLSLTATNLCTFSWNAICGNSTVVTLEKIVNGVWTTVQIVSQSGSYTLMPGTIGRFRLKSVFTGCTVYSNELEMTCPCSECDYTLSTGSALGGLDGSGASICNVYYALNGNYVSVPLNYPYHIRTGNNEAAQLDTDLSAWETTNGIGVVTVGLAACLPTIGVVNTCTNYTLVRGTSGQCVTTEPDCNCIDYVAGFIGSSECSTSLDIFTMDIYPEKANECDIIINRQRLLKQKGYTTRLEKLIAGVWTLAVANVTTLPINVAGTHHVYNAKTSAGGLGSGQYRTVVIGITSFNVPSFVNNLVSCTTVTVSGCTCPDCATIPSITFNSNCQIIINNNGCILNGWQFQVEYSANQNGPYTTINTFSSTSTTLTTISIPGSYTTPGWYRVVRIGLSENCGSVTSLPVQFNCPCGCIPNIASTNTPCQITWNTIASGSQTITGCNNSYTTYLERLVNGVWVLVSGATTPYTPTQNGQYRTRLSRAGCPDIISNTTTINCVCDCNTTTSLNYATCGALTWAECSGYTSTLQRELPPLNSDNWVAFTSVQPHIPVIDGRYRVIYTKPGCIQYSNIITAAVEYTEAILFNDGLGPINAAFIYYSTTNPATPTYNAFIPQLPVINIGPYVYGTSMVDWINSLGITDGCRAVTARYPTAAEIAANCLNLPLVYDYGVDNTEIFILRFAKGANFRLTIPHGSWILYMSKTGLTAPFNPSWITTAYPTINYPCLTNA